MVYEDAPFPSRKGSYIASCGEEKYVAVIEGVTLAIIMILQSFSWKNIEDFRNIHVVVSILVLVVLSTVTVLRLDEQAHELNVNRSDNSPSFASLANVPSESKIDLHSFQKRGTPIQSKSYFHSIYTSITFIQSL